MDGLVGGWVGGWVVWSIGRLFAFVCLPLYVFHGSSERCRPVGFQRVLLACRTLCKYLLAGLPGIFTALMILESLVDLQHSRRRCTLGWLYIVLAACRIVEHIVGLQCCSEYCPYAT